VKYLSQEEVERQDLERLSFFNVNAQNDADRAMPLVAHGH